MKPEVHRREEGSVLGVGRTGADVRQGGQQPSQVSLRQVRGDQNLEVKAEPPRIVPGRGSLMKNLEPFDRKSPEV